MLSIACTRFSRSSKFVIRPSISFAPLTHSSACWLNRSKNLPSVGIKRPNILFSVGWFGGAGLSREEDPVAGLPLSVALIDGQVTRVVAKFRVHPHPREADRADGAVTLLADNDLGGTFVRRIGVVHLVAVQEYDHVRILLDSARFAQVGHDGTFVGTLFQRAVQLGQGDHGAMQFLRQALQRARDLGDLGGPVVARLRTLHQLQVVDDDQAQLATLAGQAARPSAHLDRVQGRRLVDIQLRLVHLLDRVRQARPVFVVQLARTEAVLVELAVRTEHTHGQLGAAHLHREHGHGQARFDGDVFADVDGECRLAHGRTAGHDDPVARLQARGHAVEVDEAGRHAGDFAGAFAAVQLVDAFDHLGQQRLHGGPARRAARTLFGDGEDLRLGLVQHLLDFLALRAEGIAGDFVGDGDQLAQHAAVAHDFRVTADIRRRWRVLRHRVQVLQAAYFLGLAQHRQRLEDGDDVGGLAGIDQADHLFEDDAVIVAVEIFRVHEVGDAVPCGVIAQQAADDGLFSLDGMRRDAKGVDLRVGWCGVHGANYTCLGWA